MVYSSQIHPKLLPESSGQDGQGPSTSTSHGTGDQTAAPEESSLGSPPIRILHCPITPCLWVSKKGARRYHIEVLSNKGFWEDNMIQDVWESSELFLPNSISIFFFTWNIVNLQCCVCFKYTANWFSYTYIYICMEKNLKRISIYMYIWIYIYIYICMYVFFFRFFSPLGYHKILGTVLYAIQ